MSKLSNFEQIEQFQHIELFQQIKQFHLVTIGFSKSCFTCGVGNVVLLVYKIINILLHFKEFGGIL